MPWVSYCRRTVEGAVGGAVNQSLSLPHPSPPRVTAGPYTCLRSVGQRSVAMLDFHLDRLRESAQASGLIDEVESREGYTSLEQRIATATSRVMWAFSEGIHGASIPALCVRSCMDATILLLIRVVRKWDVQVGESSPNALSPVCVPMVYVFAFANTYNRLGRELCEVCDNSVRKQLVRATVRGDSVSSAWFHRDSCRRY